MSTPTITPPNVPTNDLPCVDFDYDKYMQQPFYEELYNLFTQSKQTSKWTSLYPCTFSAYLHAAHNFCTYLMGREESETEHSYEANYQAAYLYLCSAQNHEGVPKGFEKLDRWLFHPIEMFLIQHLAYAILCVSNNPATPYQLIELVQNHLIDNRYISEDWQLFRENRPNTTNGSPHPHDETMHSDWSKTKKLFYEPIKIIIKKYRASGSRTATHISSPTATEESATTETPIAASGAGPIRLNIKQGKYTTNQVNVMHIFNIMHEMGYFTDAYGNTITKKGLFDALATFFDCPNLKKWSGDLANSRKRANADYSSQSKIFKEMKKIVTQMEKAQSEYLKRLEKAKEVR